MHQQPLCGDVQETCTGSRSGQVDVAFVINKQKERRSTQSNCPERARVPCPPVSVQSILPNHVPHKLPLKAARGIGRILLPAKGLGLVLKVPLGSEERKTFCKGIL